MFRCSALEHNRWMWSSENNIVGWFRISQHPLLDFLFVEAPLPLWQTIQDYFHFQVPHKHRDQRKVGAGKAEPVQGRHFVLHVLHKRRRRATDGRRRGALQQRLEVKKVFLRNVLSILTMLQVSQRGASMDHQSTWNGSKWKDNKLRTRHLLLLRCQLVAEGDGLFYLILYHGILCFWYINWNE